VIDRERVLQGMPTLYQLLSEEAPSGTTVGRTDTTRTIETSDESASPIEPIITF
jgi:hypothetical protein